MINSLNDIEIPGAADLEAVIAEHGDDPTLDDLVRRIVARCSVLALGVPVSDQRAQLLQCEVPVGGVTISIGQRLPRFQAIDAVERYARSEPPAVLIRH